MIRFAVPGVPQPQGSKSAYVVKGRAVLVEGRRGPAREQFRSWRSNVSAAAAEACQQPLGGPVTVRVEFRFTRPKSHYGTGRNAHIVKGSAPDYPAGRPDLDKLARAVLDALTGICFADDGQVVHLNCWKSYGQQAGAEVEVYPVGMGGEKASAA